MRRARPNTRRATTWKRSGCSSARTRCRSRRRCCSTWRKRTAWPDPIIVRTRSHSTRATSPPSPKPRTRKKYKSGSRGSGDGRPPARRPHPLAPPPPAPPPPPIIASRPAVVPVVAKSSALPTGPVLVAGAGTALLVAGGVLYWRAWDKHGEAERICPCYPATYTSWEVLTNVSYALLAVGGATVAGGVTWWVVGEPAPRGEPSHALLGVGGRF